MRTTMDRAGRLVVPKAMRDRMGMANGGEVEINERDGTIEVTPAPIEVVVVETPDGPVLSAVGDVAPLTDEIVRDALDRLRR